MRAPHLLSIALLACGTIALGHQQAAPDELPATATDRLASSLDAARPHTRHVWRDTPPSNADGTVNAYIEIARGDRRKWEFDISANTRAIDRMIPEDVGGYPVNYGFVPQTISYDGDPFDALVLGPPLAGGTLIRGVVIGLMHMEDEKGLDSKVVLSAAGADGRPLYALTADDERLIGDYFNRYKQHDAKTFSKVPGWGSVAEGRRYVATTHAFFEQCRASRGQPCRVAP
jgi:inorganic pyrophosphatase